MMIVGGSPMGQNESLKRAGEAEEAKHMVVVRKEEEEGKDNKVEEEDVGIALNRDPEVCKELVGIGKKVGMGTADKGRDIVVHNSPFSIYLT